MEKEKRPGLDYNALTPESKFFIVFNPRLMHQKPPKKLYTSLKDAMDDAERMSRDQPGDFFFVCSPMGCFHQPAPDGVEVDLCEKRPKKERKPRKPELAAAQ